MTESTRLWHWCAWIVMAVSIALQAAVSNRLGFGGGQPDFPLAAALVAGSLGGPVAGANLGFVAGGASAGLAGEAVGTEMVTRTVIAWSAGAAMRRWIQPGVAVALFAVGVGTLITGIATALAAPTLGTERILSATVAGVPLNVAVALPMAWLLSRVRANAQSHGG